MAFGAFRAFHFVSFALEWGNKTLANAANQEDLTNFAVMEKLLREKIEYMVGRKMNVPRDFAWLSDVLEERTNQRISASTLRRFWGYVNEGVTASRYTKDVLAHFLGYADFEEFKSQQCTGDAESQPILGEQVSSDDLFVGQMLRLSWFPDRMCIVRYDGDGHFTVIEAQNTRIAEGDTFECHLFISNEPAYLNALKHGCEKPVTYAIGKKNGIKVERYLAD